MARLPAPAAFAIRLLLLALYGEAAPTAGLAQDQRTGQQAAGQPKEKPELCPAGWGKRPRRTGGPGAESYVNAWKPCKTGPRADAAEAAPPSLPPAARN